MTERRLPTGLAIARTTPTWTIDTVPPALLGEHHTSVWAELVVEAGTVTFVEVDGPEAPWEAMAAPGKPVVIVPERQHRIELSDDARFHVVFYAAELR